MALIFSRTMAIVACALYTVGIGAVIRPMLLGGADMMGPTIGVVITGVGRVIQW